MVLMLSFLALSIISLGQEGWVYDKNHKCRCWSGNIANRYFTWTGSCTNGNISGKGVLKMFESDTLIYTFSGTTLNGKYSGTGILLWVEGYKYSGLFKENMKDGQGTYNWPDGERYIGQWKNDKQHGYGILIEIDGEKYTGQWKEDMKNGQGTNLYPDGSKYVGQWKDGMKEGKGTLTWSDGSKYVGDWSEDEKSSGKFFWKNGDSFIGEFVNNKMAFGTYYFANGNKFSGLFTEDEKIKKGLLTDKSDKVIEEYVDGLTKSQLDERNKKELYPKYVSLLRMAYNDETGFWGKRSGKVVDATVYNIEPLNSNYDEVYFDANCRDFYGFKFEKKFRLTISKDGSSYSSLKDGWEDYRPKDQTRTVSENCVFEQLEWKESDRRAKYRNSTYGTIKVTWKFYSHLNSYSVYVDEYHSGDYDLDDNTVTDGGEIFYKTLGKTSSLAIAIDLILKNKYCK